MARIATILSVLVSAATIQTVFASPSCAYRYKGKPDCLEKCKESWGWSDGLLNSNPWGSVVVSDKVKDTIEAYIAQACGSSVPAAPSSTSAAPSPPPSSTAAALVTSQPPASTRAPEKTSVTSSRASSNIATTSAQPEITPPSFLGVSVSAPVVPSTTPSPPPPSSTSTRPAPTTTKVEAPPPAKPTSSSVKVTSTPPAPPPPPPSPSPSPAPAPPAPAPAPQPPTTGSGSTSAADIAEYLKSHNDFRRQHGAADLTWSDELGAAAQKWANNCQFKHSGGAVGPFGENLSAGTNLGIAAAIKMWTDEVKDYDPANPTFSHFTQVVWKGTTQVGCAVQTCNGLLGGTSAIKFYVCEYNPAGNVLGRFAENVQK